MNINLAMCWNEIYDFLSFRKYQDTIRIVKSRKRKLFNFIEDDYKYGDDASLRSYSQQIRSLLNFMFC
jgi:hypothetical protein